MTRRARPFSLEHSRYRSDGALVKTSGDARQALAVAHRRPVEHRRLRDDSEPFDALLQRCRALADKVKAAVQGAT